MRSIYIAGPMTGYEKYNFPAFFAAEEALKEMGWTCKNPARMDVETDGVDGDDPHPEKLGLAHFMKRDLPAVASCDAIALLDGWAFSTGANLELEHAIKLGKEVYWLHRDSRGVYTLIGDQSGAAKPNAEILEKGHAIMAAGDKAELGLQLDEGKIRLELVPPSLDRAVAVILGDSAEPKGKYPARNWEKGLKYMANYGSLKRHLDAWREGEDVDKESGHSHLWHAACRLAFLIEWERTGKGIDDRGTE